MHTHMQDAHTHKWLPSKAEHTLSRVQRAELLILFPDEYLSLKEEAEHQKKTFFLCHEGNIIHLMLIFRIMRTPP